MGDKKKTIKGATDAELDNLLIRLRKEREVQDLIRRLLENGNPSAYRYGERAGISTEVPIEDLYHYGVLGMKWGVRKGKGSPSAKSRKSVDTVKKMTDAELRKKINRIQMEKQYAQLTKSESAKGRKVVTGILAAAGTQVATKYAAKYLTKGVELAIEKAMKG